MNDPTPAMPARRRRLPDYAADGPLHLLMLNMGLSVDDPRDVLLAAAYRLAARLERRTAPWDAEGDDLLDASYAARLTAGPYSAHLRAHFAEYTDLGRGVL
ncbi:hypothetical protein GCM10010495_18090 [Kitasatospora herbaricolor]|uniref:hypothetical protein n=1 Tax=Kitasatospora herbaricolor TaxID=68217 RepID=UPI001749C659|nr:hypothetical protein [Kitasatospora herbaricolor]MDQ0308257.1 hypothetical protein [Kitasatospora herbaricolor]GGV06329.1 hypothetical protein GCM10010495_18090 [Kitasatospora herbaricolor]